jgi:hypothetical protein
MELYAASDLHANNRSLGIVDERTRRVFRQWWMSIWILLFFTLKIFFDCYDKKLAN